MLMSLFEKVSPLGTSEVSAIISIHYSQNHGRLERVRAPNGVCRRRPRPAERKRRKKSLRSLQFNALCFDGFTTGWKYLPEKKKGKK